MSLTCLRNWLEQQNLFPVDKLGNWDVLPVAIYYTAYYFAYAAALAAGAFTLARFLLKTFLVFTQTFLLRGKSVCLIYLHLQSASDACISAQDIWCRQRCLGRFVECAGRTNSLLTIPAVVTGASDGIGKEFALQLASAGFNTLLVARNQAMLSNVADEIGASVPDPSHIRHISHTSSIRVKLSGRLARSRVKYIWSISRRRIPTPSAGSRPSSAAWTLGYWVCAINGMLPSVFT